MNARVQRTVRDLHVLAGLFVSPLLLLFAVSAILLVHGWAPRTAGAVEKRTVSNLPVPPDLEKRPLADQLTALRGLLAQLQVSGEIGHVRYVPRERRMVLPVNLPGRETTVDLHLEARTAHLTTRRTGLAAALIYLHRMPGPHNVAIRGNSGFMQAWRWVADASVVLVLGVTVSGLLWWWWSHTLRRSGVIFFAVGACTLAGLVGALVR
jgi:hypothetical protein